MIHRHLFDIVASPSHIIMSCYTCPTCAKITPCALLYTHTRECMETIRVKFSQMFWQDKHNWTLIWSWEWRELSKHAPIIFWEFQLTVYRILAVHIIYYVIFLQYTVHLGFPVYWCSILALPWWNSLPDQPIALQSLQQLIGGNPSSLLSLVGPRWNLRQFWRVLSTCFGHPWEH